MSQSGRIKRKTAMQFNVVSTSPAGAVASGVASPGMNGLTLQPSSGSDAASSQFASNCFHALSGHSGDETGADLPAFRREQADVAQSFLQFAGSLPVFVVGGIGGFKFHDIHRRARRLEFRINFRVQRAEADAQAQVGFTPQCAEQRQHHFARRHRVLAGLDVHVRHGRRALVDEQFGDFVVLGAGAFERTVVAPHPAIGAVFPAKIGDFHHAAHKHLAAEFWTAAAAACSCNAFLSRTARQQVSRLWAENP